MSVKFRSIYSFSSCDLQEVAYSCFSLKAGPKHPFLWDLSLLHWQTDAPPPPLFVFTMPAMTSVLLATEPLLHDLLFYTLKLSFLFHAARHTSAGGWGGVGGAHIFDQAPLFLLACITTQLCSTESVHSLQIVISRLTCGKEKGMLEMSAQLGVGGP